MDLQNFIYLLLALVWLSGLIWASVIGFKSKKGGSDEVRYMR